MCAQVTVRASDRGFWRRGFTLIELLVVVAIIALLISILLPSLSRARDQAKTAVCSSNLHQLAIISLQYSDENQGRLPRIRGTTGPSQNNAPYLQSDTIFNMWPYLKEFKAYRCPSARDENSVRIYDDGQNIVNPSGRSRYVVVKTDSRFIQAFQQGWFPLTDPFALPGTIVPELYVEYWYNDWSEGANNSGRPLPQINGGVISKIPNPQYTTIICDAIWEEADDTKLRHNKGGNFAFLDGHVERRDRDRYMDRQGTNAGHLARDFDAFGNRPFWCWGLSREGFDALGGGGQ